MKKPPRDVQKIDTNRIEELSKREEESLDKYLKKIKTDKKF